MKAAFAAAALLVLLAYTSGSPIRQPGEGPSLGLNSAQNFHRIYNGTDAAKAQFPFLVRLDIRVGDSGRFLCGGSIIDERWILTSAHCVIDSLTRKTLPAANVSVVVGDHMSFSLNDPNEVWTWVDTISVHPGYRDDFYIGAESSEDFMDFDIALLQLREELRWSKAVQPIKMPQPNTDSQYEEGTPVTVAGWGKTENGDVSNTLRYLETEFSPTDSCKALLDSILYGRFDITENMICTGTKPIYGHSWGGDSGGPLFSMGTDGWVQYAIVSLGPVTAKDCYPINTRLDRFVHWAIEVMVDSNQTIAVQHNPTGPFGEWHEKLINRYDYHRIQLNGENDGFVTVDIKLNFLAPSARLYIYNGVDHKSENIIGILDEFNKTDRAFWFSATRVNEPLYVVALAGDNTLVKGGAWGTFGSYSYRATLQSVCPPGYWLCEDGRECIPEDRKCDGEIGNCLDGSDELEETCIVTEPPPITSYEQASVSPTIGYEEVSRKERSSPASWEWEWSEGPTTSNTTTASFSTNTNIP